MRALKRLFMLLWLPGNVIFSAGLIVSAYIGGVNPEKFPIGQVINMTFPFFALLSVVILVVNIFVSRTRLLWLSILSILVCWTPITANFPLHFMDVSVTEDEKKTEFTVMSYNVFNFVDHQGVNPEWGNRTVSYILSQAPDIVCLQEAYSLLGRGACCNKSQQDSLKSIYQYYIDTPGLAGELILSRYPVEKLPVPHSKEWGTGQYTAYRVDVDGSDVTIVNCHLQSLGLTPDDKALYRELTDKESKPTRSELSRAKHDIIPKLLDAFKLRAEQVDSISEFLQEVSGDVILLGDFNDVPGSFAYRSMLRAGLKDAYASSSFGPMITYNDNRFYFRIDHIFYRGDLKAISVERGDLKSSDHYPLVATFVRTAPARE